MPRKTPGRDSLTVVLTSDDYDEIKRLAAKKNTSMNEIAREWIIQGLNGEITKDNIDFLAPIIRSQLKSLLDPAIERLASLSVKSYIEAATSSALTAETINRLVHPELREDVADIYESARKNAIRKASKKGESNINELGV